MTTPTKLNEFNHTEDPARRLLERQNSIIRSSSR